MGKTSSKSKSFVIITKIRTDLRKAFLQEIFTLCKVNFTTEEVHLFTSIKEQMRCQQKVQVSDLKQSSLKSKKIAMHP
jgi:hypothetical protein